METLTISNFDYYSFKNKDMVYVVGSAFYGLYFIVSYPMYYTIDENKKPHTILNVIMESLGSAMLVLLLLDFCRLYLNIPLNITGTDTTTINTITKFTTAYITIFKRSWILFI